MCKAHTGGAEVDKFLEEIPQYNNRLLVERFSFATPMIVEDTVSHSSAGKAGKAKMKDKMKASSNNN
ncbi:hypothetical protein GUJ93_ZPchr0005g15158 [Zizania palustris]|uniref:Uncharacterized protein n=1 Tax=Zizania palustris TaxID=103762 RepID=A0A8J5S536_ZIZPA|nr:hypothetical protein GUJ93_ZPchr0005g15158 [Zizania palustris]